jgi:hypothetical protein
VEPPRDQRPADDDDQVGEDEPAVQRSPPEVERLDAFDAEDDERRDEADVRRVEDVRAAVLDHVLREQRQPGDDREDVPVVGAPRIADLRVGRPQDQGHAAARQHRARGQTNAPLERSVRATSMTAQVRMPRGSAGS